MSLWDQGGVSEDLHPDVAAFIAKTRGKFVHQLKESLHGVVKSKCGLENVPRGQWTGWGSEVTCPNCKPSELL